MKIIIVLCWIAAVAHADAPARALVVHLPPTAVAPGEPIALEATIDAPFAEVLEVMSRPIGDTKYVAQTFERSSTGGWYATLPPAHAPGVEYYIRGRDAAGAEVDHFASASAPHAVRVDPTVVDTLEAMSRTRLHDYSDEVAVDVTGHDFGNRYGIGDRFLRSEVAYTHRFLREIDHIAFGFGSISGHTPLAGDTMAGRGEREAMRYGFGEIGARIHPSVFLEARADLGTTTSGFGGGARGVLTLGKPWRSCLQFGGEYLSDLGGSGWVRLQWDTAPPVLMGASIVRTDLPGAMVSAAGLYIAYDVAYRFAERWSGKVSVSYGSRDGAAHFGGGVGAAVAF